MCVGDLRVVGDEEGDAALAQLNSLDLAKLELSLGVLDAVYLFTPVSRCRRLLCLVH